MRAAPLAVRHNQFWWTIDAQSGLPMTLDFPNESRSYDATRCAVRFWGHDSAMEWSFFVTAEALKRVEPSMIEYEADMLAAFDKHRGHILAAAAKVYKQGRKGSYELGPTDV